MQTKVNSKMVKPKLGKIRGGSKIIIYVADFISGEIFQNYGCHQD